MDELLRLAVGSTVAAWREGILIALDSESDKKLTLLTLMRAVQLQSRNTKHPFNDALSELINEGQVIWKDEPGQAISVCLAAARKTTDDLPTIFDGDPKL